MADKPTAELSPCTWRFFNQMKHRPREPIGEVIDRFVARVQTNPVQILYELDYPMDSPRECNIIAETTKWIENGDKNNE